MYMLHILVFLCSLHTHFLAMLCKPSKPMIGKLSELLVWPLDAVVTSPRSPLDLKNIQSSRGLKNYEVGGIGLGIVVALDQSGEHGREVLPRHVVCSSRNLQLSDPIPVLQSIKNSAGFGGGCHEIDVGAAAGSSENYTYVTFHVPHQTFTKVYYNGSEVDSRRRYDNVCLLRACVEEVETSFSTSDFLTSCHLCGKKLHGEDIYMYRGKKGFCSNECRSRQIMMDERKEKCRSEASRSVEMASSPAYTRRQIFSPGILVI